MTRLTLSLVTAIVVAAPATAQTSRLITDFDEPFGFSYLAFEKTTSVQDGAAHVSGRTSQGGAGVLKSMDLSALADHSPVMWIKTGPSNQAREFKMFFASGDAKRMFSYSLEGIGANAFARVLPQDGLAVSPALTNEIDNPFDPAKITALQVQGDWSQQSVDVFIDKIELVPPNAEIMVQRTAYAKKMVQQAELRRREEEQRRQEIERLLANAPHPSDGPRVVHVGPVAANILAVTIEDGTIVPRKQYPYRQQDGDEISSGRADAENMALQWDRGRIVDAPKDRVALRPHNEQGQPQPLGALIADDTIIAPGPMYQGVPLTMVTVDRPPAYRIVSDDDPRFAQPVVPAKIFVKCQPIGQANNQIPVRCIVYLKMEAPFTEGATYRIEFRGINTRQEHVAYRHGTRDVLSSAIHVTQIGYRPTDPFKRAYLSTWLGTGGKLSYDLKSFEIIDPSTGASVYRGAIALGFAAERAESMRGQKNHTQTDVYYLDFHDFRQPGTYRIHVPGIGVSRSFEIADDAWMSAFEISMHGFLAHRSGIALGPPATSYERPRPMHPEDGATVFELDITYWNGEAAAVDRALRRLLGPSLDGSRMKQYPAAWGGYMDAGDWDRRSQHLTCTLTHLELFELFPTHFADRKLAVPLDEADDGIPDLLNEALWNLDCYRRLQRPDGGVGGGIESTSHPKPGEASWQESLLLGTFAPDPETSLRYAACAARAARLLQPYDAARAAEYARSAARAWDWADANEQSVIRAAVRAEGSRATDAERLTRDVQITRALASIELYRLTGKKDYHAAFVRSSWLGTGRGDPGTELDVLFAYALQPAAAADTALQAKAVDFFEQAARESMAFAGGNAFNVTCRVAQLPMIGFVAYYSVPETAIGCVLPRAHYLTGKEEYLQGALAAAQFSAGANPMNMTLTTGVGHSFPQHPLHVDSQHAGMAPPRGITVYGNSDPSISDGSVDWAHTWFLNKTMVPNSRTWPAAEFYVDLGNWPPMNEYTVHQTFRPVSFYWGYLAARK